MTAPVSPATTAAPDAGQPAPILPATPPAATGLPAPAPAPQPAASEPPKPAPPEKTFTQADLDRIITDRLAKQEKQFGERLAGLFGATPEGDGKLTAEQVLAQAQQITENARQQANHATAESLAQLAGIKPERIDTFVGLVDLKAALSGVDVNDAAAVKAAIRAAVDAKATEFPEWKGSTLPAASTANPNGAPGAPTLDQQIAKAESEKNWKLAITLKRQRAALQADAG